MEWLCPQCRRRYDSAIDVCPEDDTPLVQDRRGQTIAGSTLDALLAVGVDGATVWEAKREGDAPGVAIKVQPVDDDEERESLAAAARAAAALRHPGLVSIERHGFLPTGELYLVMELLEGDSLAGVLAAGEPLDAGRAVAITAQILEALHQAHDAGVAHLDLKPSNVVIGPAQGERPPRVTLLDVGLGRPLPPDPPTALGLDRGADDEIPEALAYTAPEQLVTGRGEPSSDLYAVGALFFEMLCGRPPFVGRRADLKRGHLSRKPPRLAEHAELDEPDAFQTVVDRLLAKRPAQRYASAAEARLAVDALRPAPVVDVAPVEAPADDGVLDAMEDSFQNLPVASAPERQPAPPVGAPSPAPYGPPPAVEPDPPQSTARAWPLVFALLLVGGVAAWWFLGRPPEQPVERPTDRVAATTGQTEAPLPAQRLAPDVSVDAAVPVDAARPADAAPVVDAAAPRAMGALTSEPPGAEIRLADGRQLGTTPWQGLLPADVRAVELTLDGYAAATVTLDADEARRGGWSHTVTLEERPRPTRRRRSQRRNPVEPTPEDAPDPTPAPDAAPTPEPPPPEPPVAEKEPEKKGPVVLGDGTPTKGPARTRVQTLGDQTPVAPSSDDGRVPVLK